MTSPARALIAAPSSGRALHPVPGEARSPRAARVAPRVRWGIRAPAAQDAAGAAAVLAATAGLWTAFLLAVW